VVAHIGPPNARTVGTLHEVEGLLASGPDGLLQRLWHLVGHHLHGSGYMCCCCRRSTAAAVYRTACQAGTCPICSIHGSLYH
jgi:hypothetical protein